MTDDVNLDNLISQLVMATDKSEKLSIYKAWADRYDSDLRRKGYVAPEKSVELFSEREDRLEALIYDAGCGTGLVGSKLTALGYNNLVGADFSEDMLGIARQRGHYSELLVADYTQPINHENDYFDAAISVGVYSSEFDGVLLFELARMVKPAGIICFSCRPVHYIDHAEVDIEKLVAGGMVEVSYKHLDTYMTEGAAQAWYLILTVLK